MSDLRLSVSETSPPSVTADAGSNALWHQNTHWIRGAGWNIDEQASADAGIASFQASINGTSLPTTYHCDPDVTNFQQCPASGEWVQSNVDPGQYGQGNIELVEGATSAAGDSTTPSEVIHVDDTAPQVALSLANDPDPNLWVSHAVTVLANATAGPSGIAGTTCSVDGGKAISYPASGLVVNGTGQHTVSCTTTNNAVNTAGVPASATATTSFKIDETAPTISFAPRDPTDPDMVVANVTDGQSGAQGGSIEIAPAGTQDWTQDAMSDGPELIDTIDDTNLTGPYVIQAYACDKVGNCSTLDEDVQMPLRAVAASDVSFGQLETAEVCTTRSKRVRVGAHRVVRWKKGHIHRLSVGGRVKRLTVRECTKRPSNPRPILSKRVAYGQATAISGVVETSAGAPLVGQQVQVETAPANGLGDFTTIGTAVTDGAGVWSFSLPAGPSRMVRAVYPGSLTDLPATGQATLTVPAKVNISIKPHRVRWGRTIVITGRVLGGYVPQSSKLLRLDIGIDGVRAIQGIPNINPNGTFRTTYTFRRLAGRVRFWFTVSTLNESAFPWAPAQSKRVYVTVS